MKGAIESCCAKLLCRRSQKGKLCEMAAAVVKRQ